MLTNFLIKIIELYQRTLSPDYGWFSSRYPAGYCKYTPTCSNYFKDSLRKYGIIIGSLKGFWRILRCNPWSKGGEDQV